MLLLRRRLVAVILMLALSILVVQQHARADDEALHIFDLARQVHTENVENGNFTAWVNGNMGNDESGRPGKLEVGQPMPAFEFQFIDSDAVLSSASLPPKPYILNFWASWCPPCRDEFPLLAASVADHRLNVPIYFVDVFDKKTDAVRFVARLAHPVKVAIEDTKKSFTKKTGIEGIPQTVLVDANGKIQAIHSGNMTDYTIEFFNEIAHHPNLGGFNAKKPDEPPEDLLTDSGKSALSRAQ